jgi:hypothetical protein
MILKFEGSLGRPTLISEVSGTPGTLSLMGPSPAIEPARFSFLSFAQKVTLVSMISVMRF